MENKKSLNHKESETIVALTKLPTQVIQKEKVAIIKGPQGYKGSPGYPGAQGPKGAQGAEGPPGVPNVLIGKDGENLYSKRYVYTTTSLTISVPDNNAHILCNGELTLTYNLGNTSTTLSFIFISFVSTHDSDIQIILPATSQQSASVQIIEKFKKVLVCFFKSENKWYIFEG